MVGPFLRGEHMQMRKSTHLWREEDMAKKINKIC